MLSAAERLALDEQGFVLRERALDDTSVRALRLAFEHGAETPAASGTQHVTITAATPEAHAWRALREHPLLLACAEHVLRRPFRVGMPHGRNPLPRFGRQGLHADWRPRRRGEPFQVVTSIWFLDDFTAQNGSTRIVPGSHHALAVPKALGQPLAHDPRERVVVGPAGAALVFNGHLWHSGTLNETGGPRRAVQLLVHSEQAYRDGEIR